MKIFILELFFYYFFLLYLYWRVGYIYNRNGNLAFLVQKCRIPPQSSLIRTLRSKFLSLDRTFSSCRYSRRRGEYVRWNNFLDVLPHPQGLGPLFTGQWNLYAQNPDSSSHLFGTSQGAGTAILTLLGGIPSTNAKFMANRYCSSSFSYCIYFSCCWSYV
ncbi:hypothetical protein RND81_O163300 [Saponaria officinalis]|uniref:Uncharacterized protein n=1 Tax=Saponaria officinalis TaxID=3572 RepID=A0AAW1GA01_SAPOF